MTRRHWDRSTWVILGLVAFARPEFVQADEPTPYNCGFMALSTLSRLEGSPIEPDQLRSHLPAPKPAGYSMKELRDAARACGLGLSGVRLSTGDRSPNRPVLFFLKRRSHGHFVVVRPVGSSGKMVQVIDSAADPEVMDAAVLYASPEWTGLALVPVRPNWPLRIASGLGLGTVAIVLVRRLMTRW